MTRYGRIERMVPHRVLIFIVVGASKIKAIESSFGDRGKMKRLLRETDYRGYKIMPSAVKPYFLPCFVEFGWGVFPTYASGVLVGCDLRVDI